MRTALWPLQQALFQRLTEDAALMARITGVHDEVAEETPLPYITLGEDTVSDYSTKTFDGEDITHTLHVWSGYKGKKEAKEILDLALQAIIASPLALAGDFQLEDARREMLEVFKDEDAYHGVMRLRFKITQL